MTGCLATQLEVAEGYSRVTLRDCSTCWVMHGIYQQITSAEDMVPVGERASEAAVCLAGWLALGRESKTLAKGVLLGPAVLTSSHMCTFAVCPSLSLSPSLFMYTYYVCVYCVCIACVYARARPCVAVELASRGIAVPNATRKWNAGKKSCHHQNA
jgi:hypothetical protein